MIGWLSLLLLVAVALAALRLLGLRGSMLQAAGAALLFGSAGYAVQGKPGLAGSPASGAAERQIVPLTEARHAFFGSFSSAETWLRLSEGLGRAGRTDDAVGLLQNAARRYPADPHLWIGLGNALVDHARGITPPAELAYRRAAELSPGYPAPAFFYALALARSGNRQAAVAIWHRLLQDSPADASWRPLVAAAIIAATDPRR